ncbi:MAG: methyltransferase domain-containing protein [Deinococcus sp.]|nr:methyltransferase domain-containing protein [Deinococcus sp.]
MPDFQALNRRMVDALRREGVVRSPRVEAAFLAVPRHLFVREPDLERVYDHRAGFTLFECSGRAVSTTGQALALAYVLEGLNLAQGMRVLEVGSGSGFQAALLAHIVGPAGQVVSLDIFPEMVELARANLAAAGVAGVELRQGDGGLGWAERAPFDRIVVAASGPELSPHWRQQLIEDGLLFMPLRIGPEPYSAIFRRQGDSLVSQEYLPLVFVRLQGEYADQREGEEFDLGQGLIGQVPLEELGGQWLHQLLAGRRRERALAPGQPGVHLVPPQVYLLARAPLPLRPVALRAASDLARQRLGGDQGQGVVKVGQGLALMCLTRPANGSLLSLQAWGEPAVEEVLRTIVAQWIAAGCPGPEAVQVTALDALGPVPLLPQGRVVDQGRTRLLLTVPTNGAVLA